jgi:regulatory protein
LLKGEVQPDKVRETAFRLLAIRSRSIQELRGRLEKKGFEKGAIEKLLIELQERGYLDDRQFADQWACYYREVKGYGFFRVRGELIKKGIEGEIISEVMKRLGLEEDEMEKAKEVAKRYLKGAVPSDIPPAGQAKLAQYMKRRGYSWDVIGGLLKGKGFDG